MLGKGAGGRDVGGFFTFAAKYIEAEGSPKHAVDARCSFERYQDFAFYTGGNWEDGHKFPILIAECESSSGELLGELAGLISVRCPHKYLFIDGRDTLARLDAYCNDSAKQAYDWGRTIYHVIEIPNTPSRSSTWQAYVTTVNNTGDQLRFR
jgi:hypothetical protein